jgi:hypothetical protein
MSEDDDFRATRLRPYAVTGGRTRSRVELGIEAMVRTTPAGARGGVNLGVERRRITEMCRKPLSVAEISAHLDLHLQATRVLVGDLVAEGHLETSATGAGGERRPDLRLLEKVLDGLQSL